MAPLRVKVVLFGQSAGVRYEALISHMKNYLLKAVGSLGSAIQAESDMSTVQREVGTEQWIG